HIGQNASLSRAMVSRLSMLVKTEQDSLVWRSAMQAIFQDAADEAAQTALLALNSQWPDVRILGCQYVGHHGRRDQAHWLLPLFRDSSRTVQVAAIAAAGLCRNPTVLDGLAESPGQPALPGLRSLLAESQGQLR